MATELDDLRVLPRGTVLHWGASHFVVLDSASRRGVTIVDPMAGRYRVSWTLADELYSGVAIIRSPAPTSGGGRPGWGRCSTHAGSHLRPGIGKVLAASVVVRIMALAVPILTGVVVDEVVPAGDGHLLTVLAAVMLAPIAYSTLATFLRAHLLLRLRSRLDVEMTLGFLEHLVDLPYAFFPEALLRRPDDVAAQQRRGPRDPDHGQHRVAARRRLGDGVFRGHRRVVAGAGAVVGRWRLGRSRCWWRLAGATST